LTLGEVRPCQIDIAPNAVWIGRTTDIQSRVSGELKTGSGGTFYSGNGNIVTVAQERDPPAKRIMSAYDYAGRGHPAYGHVA